MKTKYIYFFNLGEKKTKGLKQYSQYRLGSPMPEGDVHLFLSLGSPMPEGGVHLLLSLIKN